MKILILSGTHSRHLYFHKAVLSTNDTYAAVIMERESMKQDTPKDLNEHNKKNFDCHFQKRFEIEKAMYSNLNSKEVFLDIPTIECNSKTLNDRKVINFVRNFSPDLCIIFGTNIIKNDLMRALPENTINLHLGISPYYRGSATLFWPFYFLEPQFAGATFHKIVREPDAGQILHQLTPKLEYGDGLHKVAAKTVIKAAKEIIKLIEIYKEKKWAFSNQSYSGKLYLSKDFKAAHLRVIYDLYEDKIVDAYLKGDIGHRLPKIIRAF